jgi:hypothetical protein
VSQPAAKATKEKVEALQRAFVAFEAAQFGELNNTREALMQAATALGWEGSLKSGDSWPWSRRFLMAHGVAVK